jgi:Peptidase S46
MRWFLKLLAVIALISSFCSADEGLWLYNAAPKDKLKARYNFTLTDAWLDHVRESSVRFNNGGSGSFVSPNGLTFTNHHVAADCLSKISTADHDYIKTGYYAKNAAEEARCPDLELNVVTAIEDVTAKVNAPIKSTMSSSEAAAAQRSAMSAIEADCAKTGLRCDVVTLYSGGLYHLYKYKKYTDVRLVFAPEFAVASFGGDPDNFEFPRYDLDVTFFRVYENDKPVVLKDWLTWTTVGPKEGELVFMSGNPGSTSRMATLTQLDFFRGTQYPLQLKWREATIKATKEFAAQSEENKRITESRLWGLLNSQKSQNGYFAALKDMDLMAQKAKDEKDLRARLTKSDASLDSAWINIARAMQTNREMYLPLQLIERLQGLDSRLADIARTLVRAGAERQKPNGDRLREFRESALASLEQDIFSPAPIYDALEKQRLTLSLQRLVDELGRDDAFVKRILGDRTPAAAADFYVSNTRLKDVAVRKALYQGGWESISKSSDPLISVLRDIDPRSRELKKRYDDEVDAVVRHEAGRIAQARFKTEGLSVYPDATFTLRLSYGTAQGYTEDGRGSIVPKGTRLPFFTVLKGVFDREQKMGGQTPYELPSTWHARKAAINLDTPMNFVSTADSIGGSSGSPIVNKKGEIIGINFDRNIQGLGRNFYYSEVGMRHIAVDTRGITEALRNVYNTTTLVDELLGKPMASKK